MVTVSERIVSIGVSGDPAEVSAIVDKIKFKHPHARRILSHALHSRTGGEQGWDGFIRPLKKTDPDHAEALRGYKPKIMAVIEQLGIEVNPESRLLDSPFKHITVDDIPDDIIKSEFPLDENQREIIAAWLQNGMGIGKIAVNGGKTAAFAGFAAMLKSLGPGVRVLYITDRERLTTQVDREMKRFLPGWNITKFGGGSSDESGTDLVVCTLAMLRQHIADLREIGWFNTFHAIMFDECFVAGTLVDGKPIQSLMPGDYVWSVNQFGFVEKRRIKRVFKKRPSTLVKVVIDGDATICTSNHPFFVYGKGYVRADSLTTGSSVMKITMMPRSYDYGSKMSLVPNAVFYNEEMAVELRQAQKTTLLQARVQPGFFSQSVIRDNGEDQQEVCVSQNEGEQPDVDAWRERASHEENTVLQQAARSSCRKWEVYSAAGVAVDESWGRVGDGNGCRNDHQNRQQEKVTLLQSGFRARKDETSGRSGRPLTLFQETKADRHLENCSLTRGWVDSVEILEPRCDRTFGGLCPDGYVYNIEVEEAHCYYANGILVSNCESGQYGDMYFERGHDATASKEIQALIAATHQRGLGAYSTRT